MHLKSEAPEALISFMQDIGIPSDLHSNDAKELTQGRMVELLCKFWIKSTQSDPYSPWQVARRTMHPGNKESGLTYPQ